MFPFQRFNAHFVVSLSLLIKAEEEGKINCVKATENPSSKQPNLVFKQNFHGQFFFFLHQKASIWALRASRERSGV